MVTLTDGTHTEPAPGDGDAFGVARLPKRVKRSTTPQQLRDTFTDDEQGARNLAEAVAEAMHRWEIPWCAQVVEHAAFTLANWLLRNNHPEHENTGHLSLHTTFERERRQVALVVGDDGSALPTLAAGDDLRWSLGRPGAFIYAHHCEGSGREITVVMKVRSAWRVRLTWDQESFEGIHPSRSFESHESEQDALAAAESASRSVQGGDVHGRLLAIHIQGPDDADDQWTPHASLAASSVADARGDGA